MVSWISCFQTAVQHTKKRIWKKFLTNGEKFGILFKLSLRDKRKTEKFDLELIEVLKKNLKKVLDKRFWFWYNKQAIDEQLRTTKSCENSLKTADCTL